MKVEHAKDKEHVVTYEELPPGCVFRFTCGGNSEHLFMKSPCGTSYTQLTGNDCGIVHTVSQSYVAKYKLVEARLVVTSIMPEGE